MENNADFLSYQTLVIMKMEAAKNGTLCKDITLHYALNCEA